MSGRYCAVGSGLYLYWCQLAALLTEAGLEGELLRQASSYQQAQAALIQHIDQCPVCTQSLNQLLQEYKTNDPVCS